jgi:uncharacterized alkaline shock family protein YloU
VSTAVLPAPPVAVPDSGRAAVADAAGRGRTRIADRVVEKVASQAVAEVDNATGVARRVLGVNLGSAGPDSQARVDAEIDGSVVTIRVSMAVRWPASVRTVTRQVRTHVTGRVRDLTGLHVAYVDVTVPVLLAGGDDEIRRVV